MSQFRDTFTRGSKKDSVLSYDDFASRIFTSGFILCFLIPITIYLLKKWLSWKRPKLPAKLRLSDVHIESKKHPCVKCECSFCKTRRAEESKKSLKFTDHFTFSRLFQLIILATFWWIVIYLISGINPDDNIKRFDPFELLGLSTDASKKDIQKAYRHLSLKYHPDRNPNDPEMSAHFVLITKAYRTLTNEVSRMNYAKYGNPDGPGMMKIGIGLPRFLVDENNQIVILSLFFLLLLIVAPSLFLWYYRTQKNITASGIQLETLQLIYYSLNENTRHKSLPEVYSCSSELSSIPYHSSEETELRKYFHVLSDYKRKNISSETFRNFLLLMCHLNRVEDLSPKLKRSLNEVLKYSMLITHCMIDVALSKSWLITFRSVIDFRRGILQGLLTRSESFYQIPHFTEYEINHVGRGKTSSKNIEQYVKTDFKTKKGLNNLTESQKQDVEEFCKYFPSVTLEVKVYVEDEDEIYEGDLVTVEVKLRRNNLKDKELIGPIHAPFFPYVKYEQYYILLTFPLNLNKDKDSTNHVHTNESKVNGVVTLDTVDEVKSNDWENNLLLNFSMTSSREAEIVEKMQILAEKVGQNTVCVTAINDSYFGAEFSVLKKFYVNPLNMQKRYEAFKIHPEDMKLDEDVNPITKMIGELLTAESSDEEEVEYIE
ncbi:DNAJ-like sec63 homologue, putative [Theileria annulata]|uniref:DNAJ-like sec63 homologue, putative n=1 Tax=Theileria annulata TaxID=5874 RepID=Q4UEJ6_THEAN|nr:DNAJ-like sec63 homologue, putative [Theileria annulata]CAI74493.1 DNAJ-like sec63 homologue, putative [Theileria annulata]|eukprot:XP_952225.1 DNAJ-like sec63 homologue, putative [Theileria annulata]